MRKDAASGKLRIIGGTLRGSRIDVPNVPGLRPTPDRVRETLFNWLAPVIDGARCLDLFAGTGALGIEAWSRGAGAVDFIERDPRLVAALRNDLTRLRVTDATVHATDALAFLHNTVQACDIVFLDPPFAADLWTSTAHALDTRGWLKPGAWIYIEAPSEVRPSLPEHWRLHREARAGDVGFALYRNEPIP